MLRIGDRQHRDLLALVRMLIEPERKRVLDYALDDSGGLARGQAFLGLAGELRLAHLHRQNETHAIPHIFRRQFQAPRHEGAELAKLGYRVGGTRAQAVHVRAALHRRDQVDVALGDAMLRIEHPREGPVERAAVDVALAVKGLGRQPLAFTQLFREILVQATRVVPLLVFTGELVGERDAQFRAEHGLGPQHLLETGDGEFIRIEVLAVRPKTQRRSGFRFRNIADDFELRLQNAAREAHVVFLSAAAHPALQVFGQRVYDRDADTMQPAGMLVSLVVELSAGVQARQDQLDAADLLLGMNINRHAAAVVLHLQRTVLEHRDVDVLAVSRQRLVDAVVDDLVRQVVWARGVGIHARAPAHRVQAAQNLDVGGRIRRCHQ